jgi:hypothetical protein
MTEQELRALVRDAIARHAAGTTAAASGTGMPDASFTVVRQHPSHAMFAVPAGGEADGPCIIEPSVQCTHCGYCKSYGH